MAKLTSTIIEAAIAGFEAQKRSIDAQIAELHGMLTTKPEAAEETPTHSNPAHSGIRGGRRTPC
jgi:hypothetical protein